jgi:hypothetical protein
MPTSGSRLLGALVLTALLTACSSAAVKQPKPTTAPAERPTATDPAPGAPTEGDWRPVKGEPARPASVKGPGLFLVEAETGKSEFWPALSGSNVYVNLSPDSRYVWSATATESVLADREAGKSYRWSNNGRSLVGVVLGNLLWEELEGGKQTGRFRLERLDGTLIKAFSLATQNGEGDFAIPRLARLTKDAFILWQTGEQDWRVDAATGAVSDVARTEADRITHSGTGNRYAADLYQNTLPVVTVSANGVPVYRVLAAYPSCGWSGVTSSLWRADGNGLALWSAEGPIMADLAAGRIESLAVKDGTYFEDPAPSPTRNDRWGALGHSGALVELNSFGPGTTRVASGKIDWDRANLSMDTRTSLWSADGRFLQFQAFLGGGKDFGCMADMVGQPFLPPRLEKAPFKEIAVQVATPGDCLNLRAEPSKEARVLTCLKDGTRLTFLEKPAGGNGPYTGFYPGWAYVQTGGKAIGWVSTEGNFLRWAD